MSFFLKTIVGLLLLIANISYCYCQDLKGVAKVKYDTYKGNFNKGIQDLNNKLSTSSSLLRENAVREIDESYSIYPIFHIETNIDSLTFNVGKPEALLAVSDNTVLEYDLNTNLVSILGEIRSLSYRSIIANAKSKDYLIFVYFFDNERYLRNVGLETSIEGYSFVDQSIPDKSFLALLNNRYHGIKYFLDANAYHKLNKRYDSLALNAIRTLGDAKEYIKGNWKFHCEFDPTNKNKNIDLFLKDLNNVIELTPVQETQLQRELYMGFIEPKVRYSSTFPEIILNKIDVVPVLSKHLTFYQLNSYFEYHGVFQSKYRIASNIIFAATKNATGSPRDHLTDFKNYIISNF